MVTVMMTAEEIAMYGGKTPYIPPAQPDAIPERLVTPKEVRETVEKIQRIPRPPVRPPHAPAYSRMWTWLILQVATPYRVKRAALWSLRLPRVRGR